MQATRLSALQPKTPLNNSTKTTSNDRASNSSVTTVALTTIASTLREPSRETNPTDAPLSKDEIHSLHKYLSEEANRIASEETHLAVEEMIDLFAVLHKFISRHPHLKDLDTLSAADAKSGKTILSFLYKMRGLVDMIPFATRLLANLKFELKSEEEISSLKEILYQLDYFESIVAKLGKLQNDLAKNINPLLNGSLQEDQMNLLISSLANLLEKDLGEVAKALNFKDVANDFFYSSQVIYEAVDELTKTRRLLFSSISSIIDKSPNKIGKLRYLLMGNETRSDYILSVNKFLAVAQSFQPTE